MTIQIIVKTTEAYFFAHDGKFTIDDGKSTQQIVKIENESDEQRQERMLAIKKHVKFNRNNVMLLAGFEFLYCKICTSIFDSNLESTSDIKKFIKEKFDKQEKAFEEYKEEKDRNIKMLLVGRNTDNFQLTSKKKGECYEVNEVDAEIFVIGPQKIKKEGEKYGKNQIYQRCFTS